MIQVIVNSIIAGSIYALAGMSFNLIYGVSRTFNLAHGTVGAVAAYTVFFLSSENGAPIFVSATLAIVAAALTGLFLEFLVFRPLRSRKASNLVLMIASLGASVVMEALLAILFTSQFQTITHLIPTGTYPVLGGSITGIQVAIVASAVLTLVGLWFLLTRTSFGKAVRAISDDEEVARIVGIDTNRVITLVFILGAALMGLAGILAGFDTGLEPRMGFLLLLGAAIAAIIGGIGNVYGAFFAAFILGFAENFGVWFLTGSWKYAIAFALLTLFLLVRPQGLFGKK